MINGSKRWSLIAAIIVGSLAIMGATGKAIVWAADGRYQQETEALVAQVELEDMIIKGFRSLRIAALNDKIERINLDLELASITGRGEAELAIYRANLKRFEAQRAALQRFR